MNRTETLSDDKWFVAQTNSDWWLKDDRRYQITEQRLQNLTHANVNPNSLVCEVLRADGVLQSITIFQAAMSAALGTFNVYLMNLSAKGSEISYI